MRALATSDRRALAEAVLRLLTDVAEVEAASVWEHTDRAPRLLAFTGAAPPAPPPIDQLGEGDVTVGAAETPFLVGRIRSGIRVAGYLVVDRLPIRASGRAARLFPSLIEWLSHSAGQTLVQERREVRAKVAR
jgi:hypothetical protein